MIRFWSSDDVPDWQEDKRGNRPSTSSRTNGCGQDARAPNWGAYQSGTDTGSRTMW